MNRLSHLSLRIFLFSIACLLTSCRDYSNRVYYYHEPIALNPFVMEVNNCEYRFQEGSLELNVYLKVYYKHLDAGHLDLKRFLLRTSIGEIGVSSHDGESAAEAIPFQPEETKIIKISYQVKLDNFKEPLDLIVDQTEKKGKKVLTLIRLKSPNLTARSDDAQWHETESARW